MYSSCTKQSSLAWLRPTSSTSLQKVSPFSFFQIKLSFEPFLHSLSSDNQCWTTCPVEQWIYYSSEHSCFLNNQFNDLCFTYFKDTRNHIGIVTKDVKKVITFRDSRILSPSSGWFYVLQSTHNEHNTLRIRLIYSTFKTRNTIMKWVKDLTGTWYLTIGHNKNQSYLRNEICLIQ